MCRFVLYMGPPITIDLLTTRPVYSIVRQSFQSRMRVEPLNGDGFGVAWYVPELTPEPAVYRSIQPAWNNVNLRNLARVTRSSVIMAHVRAATSGLGVSEANCHPFTAGRLAFMHNGSVGGWARVKRPLQQQLSDEAFAQIGGTTDSEHIFALFCDFLKQQPEGDPTEQMANALEAMITHVVEQTQSLGITKRTHLNLVVSDGSRAVASRFTSGPGDAPSLYVQTGKKYACDNGSCLMVETNEPHEALLVASEPLTDEPGWKPVPRNHLLLVRPDLSLHYRPLNLGDVA